MKDINFWVGTGVGFVSAILGGLVAAWVQYRLKIKEIRYMMDQEKVKRREEEHTREEAESKRFRKLIMDTRRDVKDRGAWDRSMLGYRGRPGVSALKWYMSDDFYDGNYKEQLLNDMNLDELKALYTALLSGPFLSAEIERSEREIERSMAEMSAILRDMRSKLARDDAYNTRQE